MGERMIGTGTTLGEALVALFRAMDEAGKARGEAIYLITGRLTEGADSRVRGRGPWRPLYIDARDAIGGGWDLIEAELAADVNPAHVEEIFVDHVVTGHLGEPQPQWEFDGDSYEVTLR